MNKYLLTNYVNTNLCNVGMFRRSAGNIAVQAEPVFIVGEEFIDLK